MRDVLIVFTDGTERVITKVTDYELNDNVDCFFINKNDHKIMIPRQNVKIIGYRDDLLKPSEW